MNQEPLLLQKFTMVGLRNLKIRNRLMISYMISTIFPLFFLYLYTYSLYGITALTGKILVMVFLMSIVALTMTFYTYLSISQPIDHMVETCRSISEGDLDTRIQDTANDELAYLSDNIDGMITEIQLLLEQHQESEAKKRELELKILQYQINPHFLFNTLNTLRLVAQMNQDKVVADGILSLSELLKNTLINNQEFITIQEEIDNLKHYFSIQSIRYAGSFHVNYDIPDELNEYLLPKLLLQPLAENSVLHGTYNDGTIIEIYVSCKETGNDLLLEVRDEGKGFDMSDKTSVPKGLGGIGSRNVNDRIHLYFSGNYGLTVNSSPGEGTCCQIRIPSISADDLKTSTSGGNYVSGNNR
ncbi:MAG: histidine kinase [Lachnospiraceae bacterium]|nr:histidine kinase [Lachnospiraceae bacterium]